MGEAIHQPRSDKSERPDLSVVPPEDDLRQTYHLAAEFQGYLTKDDEYKTAQGEAARAKVAPNVAYRFIQEKVQRMPEHLRRPPIVHGGILHSVIDRFSQEHRPGSAVSAEAEKDREKFLREYGKYAELDKGHPEILGTMTLVEHAEGLGDEDLISASRILLAAYGRSLDIIRASGLRALDEPPAKT